MSDPRVLANDPRVLANDPRVLANGPRILLLFVDGIGLVPAQPENPFASCAAPALGRLLDGPLVAEMTRSTDTLLLSAIDANLGLEGLPQSATGQTTLFTGVNAAERMGRHVPAFPGPGLGAIIDANGLLRRVAESGRRVVFANAFSPQYYELLESRKRRPSVTVLLTWNAGLELLGLDDLRARRALSWDLCRDLLPGATSQSLPILEPRQAGHDLAELSARHALTMFETFLPDLVGHRRIEMTPCEVVRRIDGLIEGILERLPPNTTLVMTSDHGNFEEPSHKRHTRNPVPLLACGPQARQFADVESLIDLTPRILRCLGIEEP